MQPVMCAPTVLAHLSIEVEGYGGVMEHDCDPEKKDKQAGQSQ